MLRTLLRTFIAAIVFLVAFAAPSQAGTYTLYLQVSAGATNTGQAANIRVNIYDNAYTALVTSSNSPSGTAFVESSITTGTYRAPYTVDTSKFPITVEFAPLANGTQFSAFTIGNDRAAQVADGFSTTAITNQATAATRVTTALPNAGPSATGGLADLFWSMATSLYTGATGTFGKALGSGAGGGSSTPSGPSHI